MSEAPKRVFCGHFLGGEGQDWGYGNWAAGRSYDCNEQYRHASTLRTIHDMLNSNASRDNIRRVIEAELGGE